MDECIVGIHNSSNAIPCAVGAHRFLEEHVFSRGERAQTKYNGSNSPLYSGKSAVDFGTRVDALVCEAARTPCGMRALCERVDVSAGDTDQPHRDKERDALTTAAGVCAALLEWGFVPASAQMEVRLPGPRDTVCAPVLDLIGSKEGKLVVVELKCGHRVSSLSSVHIDHVYMKGEFSTIPDNWRNRAYAQLAMQQLAVEAHTPLLVCAIAVFVKPLKRPAIYALPRKLYTLFRRAFVPQGSPLSGPATSPEWEGEGGRSTEPLRVHINKRTCQPPAVKMPICPRNSRLRCEDSKVAVASMVNQSALGTQPRRGPKQTKLSFHGRALYPPHPLTR